MKGSDVVVDVVSDYDGFFLGLTEEILAGVVDCAYSRVVVSAGPFRSYGILVSKVDDDTVSLDYYSALRNGFGALSERDIAGVRQLLERQKEAA